MLFVMLTPPADKPLKFYSNDKYMQRMMCKYKTWLTDS